VSAPPALCGSDLTNGLAGYLIWEVIIARSALLISSVVGQRAAGPSPGRPAAKPPV
jgi:hypothetical protein